MKKIIKKIPAEVKKKYKVATVAQVLGRSEGSISGYFSNKGISTKGGITADQVEDYLAASEKWRNTGAIDWDEAALLEKELARDGYKIVDDSEA